MLEVQNIRKAFPGVLALDDVSSNCASARCTRCWARERRRQEHVDQDLTGVYRPDEGRILIDGSEVHFSSPHDAQRAGISVVHQERNLVRPSAWRRT